MSFYCFGHTVSLPTLQHPQSLHTHTHAHTLTQGPSSAVVWGVEVTFSPVNHMFI